MSRLGFYLLCGALCSLVVLGQGQGSLPSTQIIPIPQSNTTTTEEPTTTTETTTEVTTPTTTTSTSTTTPAPTPKPTPPPTPKPTPPPTPKPTPSPKPTPTPPPSQGSWFVEENNITCIVIQFAAQLNISYTKASTTLDQKVLNVPANATAVNGSCSANNGSEQWIMLSWTEESMPACNMTLVFLKNGTNYALKTLNVTLPSELFPNASSNNSIELFHKADWQTPLATSYRCGKPTGLDLNAVFPGTAGMLTISQLQEEAFRNVPGKGFSAARDCGSGDVPDAVPIAVGCALGGLVIVVLIAYLVGRRRSAARGYLSM